MRSASVLALDQLHHEGVHAGGLLDPVDRGDVGMVQRRERLRLALEPRQAFGVRRERVRQDLDRHLRARASCPSPDRLRPSRRRRSGGDFAFSRKSPTTLDRLNDLPPCPNDRVFCEAILIEEVEHLADIVIVLEHAAAVDVVLMRELLSGVPPLLIEVGIQV